MFSPRHILNSFYFSLLVGTALGIAACNLSGKTASPEEQALDLKKEIQAWVDGISPSGMGPDSSRLRSAEGTKEFYPSRQYEPIWVRVDSITPAGISLMELTQQARRLGLFPEHYHAETLATIQLNFEQDTLGTGARKDLKAWARMDALLTDAFLTLARHLQKGHEPLDSLKKNNAYQPEIYQAALNKAIQTQDPASALEALEPTSIEYKNLKKVLPDFLRTADFSKKYTRLEYPYRDSSAFIRSLIKRLKEENYLDSAVQRLDSAALSQTLKRVQTARKLKADGKYGSQLVNSLNSSDAEKFLKVVITMDRYRMQRESLPDRYIWVNLPSFFLQVYENDSIRVESRVVIGKPGTRTPLITSQISDVVTYPTWTIPPGIIAGEILPQLKRDPGYLGRKGYSLFDGQGNQVDPYSIDWSKYARSIPYRVVQGKGDDNALGVMKFNFPNKHYVYLHDTNQRSLFANENRSLSHGCVRVQNWDGLYKYIIQIDSTEATLRGNSFTSSDSVRTWLSQKERHVIPIKAKLPVYLRYYTAAGRNGKLEIYNDVYGEDRKLREIIINDKP